jgi:Adenosine-deaminase (editase) domain
VSWIVVQSPQSPASRPRGRIPLGAADLAERRRYCRNRTCYGTARIRDLSVSHVRAHLEPLAGITRTILGEIEIKLGHKDERRMDSNHDAVVDQILKKYESFGYTPPNNAFTVLAAFYVLDERNGDTKIVSIATGSKCLPTAKFSRTGDTIHDFHAEVLARRGAVRWLMQEMLRGSESWWLKWDESMRLCGFRDMVSMHMYVSTLPCMSIR